MTDDDGSSVSDRANKVIERACALDEAVINLHAFRSLLDDLSSRSPLVLPPEQLRAVEMVRAAILRSAIGLAVAILDPAREDRASLGQILKFLEDEAVSDRLTKPDPGRGAKPLAHKLAELRNRYTEVCSGQLLKRVRKLRHTVAHLLVSSEANDPVEYTEIFAIADEIREQVTMLFRAIGLRTPHFVTYETTAARAKLFLETYLAGVEHVADLELIS